MKDSELIQEVGTLFESTPVKVKEHVMNNLKEFLVVDNLEQTYENIRRFVEVTSYSYLKELFGDDVSKLDVEE